MENNLAWKLSPFFKGTSEAEGLNFKLQTQHFKPHNPNCGVGKIPTSPGRWLPYRRERDGGIGALGGK